MKQVKLPVGLRDSFSKTCQKKKKLQEQIETVFSSYGYEEITTPSIEYYQTYYKAFETLEDRNMYKFFDQDGEILTLRMDMTVPIARAITSHCKNNEHPVRLRYCANVYRVCQSYAGKRNEMTDCGIELVGLDQNSDIEVVTCALDAMRCMKCKSYILEIGNVQFFKTACDALNLKEDIRIQLADLIDRKSMVELEEYLESLDMPAKARLFFLRLPFLAGKEQILNLAYDISFTNDLKKIVVELKDLYKNLKELGYENEVTFDLAKVPHLHYYTGIIFEGFIQGIGSAVLSGGRYDHLLEKFGPAQRACGFSIKLDEIVDQMPEETVKKKIRIYYGYHQQMDALKLAAQKRKQQIVELIPSEKDEITLEEVDE